MKLRVAKKVYKAFPDDPSLARHRCSTITKAVAIVGRTKQAKLNQQYWDELMDSLGILGRAELCFDLSMNDIVRGH